MPEKYAGSTSSRRVEAEDVRDAFVEFVGMDCGHPRRAELRAWLITTHLPVAHHVAQRFAGRGQPDDDLRQVALLGLVNAVDRFDPRRATPFLAFAIPTMLGEVRRYFRDRTWTVRVPRRLQSLRASINQAVGELAQELGRSPTPTQLAAHLQVHVEEVYEGIAAASAYHATSLDCEVPCAGGRAPLRDLIGADDPNFDRIVQHETLEPLLAALPERERRIVVLRFFGNLTQSQIATEVGVSQMHVSRLLAKALARLRHELQTK